MLVVDAGRLGVWYLLLDVPYVSVHVGNAQLGPVGLHTQRWVDEPGEVCEPEQTRLERYPPLDS